MTTQDFLGIVDARGFKVILDDDGEPRIVHKVKFWRESSSKTLAAVLKWHRANIVKMYAKERH